MSGRRWGSSGTAYPARDGVRPGLPGKSWFPAGEGDQPLVRVLLSIHGSEGTRKATVWQS